MPEDKPFRGRVVSVFGPFNSRALIEVSAEDAAKMVDAGDLDACGHGVIDAADRELDALRAREPALADSALAAAVRELAYGLEHPYNSLTSKAMATRELREDMDRLRELAPPERKKDRLDNANEAREHRRARARSPRASDQVHS